MYVYDDLWRFPKVGDAKIRWHIGYAHYYVRDEKMSKLYMNLRDKYKHHDIPVMNDLTHIVLMCTIGKGDHPVMCFACSLKKLRFRSSSYLLR